MTLTRDLLTAHSYIHRSIAYKSQCRTFYGLLKKMGRRFCSTWLLLQAFRQILLLVNQAGASTTDKIIHIGYLKADMTTGGAINVAIEQAQNDGFLRDYNFRYNFYSESDFLSHAYMVNTCGYATVCPPSVRL